MAAFAADTASAADAGLEEDADTAPLLQRLRDAVGCADSQRQILLLRQLRSAVEVAVAALPDSLPLRQLRAAVVPGAGTIDGAAQSPVSPLLRGGRLSGRGSLRKTSVDWERHDPAPPLDLAALLLAGTSTSDVESKTSVAWILARLLSEGGAISAAGAAALTDAGAACVVTDGIAYSAALRWAPRCTALTAASVEVAAQLCQSSAGFCFALVEAGGVRPLAAYVQSAAGKTLASGVARTLTGIAAHAAQQMLPERGSALLPLPAALGDGFLLTALLRCSDVLGGELGLSKAENRLRCACSVCAASLLPGLAPGVFARRTEPCDVLTITRLMTVPVEGAEEDCDRARVRSALQLYAALVSWNDDLLCKDRDGHRTSGGRRRSSSLRWPKQASGTNVARMVLVNTEAFLQTLTAAPLWWVSSDLPTAEAVLTTLAATVPYAGHADTVMSAPHFGNICQLMRASWQERTSTMVQAAAVLLERAVVYPHHKELAFAQGIPDLLLQTAASESMVGVGVSGLSVTERAASVALRVLRQFCYTKASFKLAILKHPLLPKLLPVLGPRAWEAAPAAVLEALRLLDFILPRAPSSDGFTDDMAQTALTQATASMLLFLPGSLYTRSQRSSIQTPWRASDASRSSPKLNFRAFRETQDPEPPPDPPPDDELLPVAPLSSPVLPSPPLPPEVKAGPRVRLNDQPTTIVQSEAVTAQFTSAHDALCSTLSVLRKMILLRNGPAAVLRAVDLWRFGDVLTLPGCADVRQAAAAFCKALAAEGPSYEAQLMEVGLRWDEEAESVCEDDDPCDHRAEAVRLIRLRRESAAKIQGAFRGFRRRRHAKRQRTMLQYVLMLQSTYRTCRRQRAVRQSRQGIAKAVKDEERRRPRLADVQRREFRAIVEVFGEVSEHIDKKLKRRMVIHAEEAQTRLVVTKKEDQSRELLAIRSHKVEEMAYRQLWHDAQEQHRAIVGQLVKVSDMQRVQRLVVETREHKERDVVWQHFYVGFNTIQDAYAERWMLARKEGNDREKKEERRIQWVFLQCQRLRQLDEQVPENNHRLSLMAREERVITAIIEEMSRSACLGMRAVETRCRHELAGEADAHSQRLLMKWQEVHCLRAEEDLRAACVDDCREAGECICAQFYGRLLRLVEDREGHARLAVVHKWFRLFKVNGKRWRISLLVMAEQGTRVGVARQGLCMQAEIIGAYISVKQSVLLRGELGSRGRIGARCAAAYGRLGRLYEVMHLAHREYGCRVSCAAMWLRVLRGLTQAFILRISAHRIAEVRTKELSHRAQVMTASGATLWSCFYSSLTALEEGHRVSVARAAARGWQALRRGSRRLRNVADARGAKGVLDAAAAARALGCRAEVHRKRAAAMGVAGKLRTAVARSRRAAALQRVKAVGSAAARTELFAETVYSARAWVDSARTPRTPARRRRECWNSFDLSDPALSSVRRQPPSASRSDE